MAAVRRALSSAPVLTPGLLTFAQLPPLSFSSDTWRSFFLESGNSIMIQLTDASPSNMEESLNHASHLLQCAAVTAYESGDRLSGADRLLAMSVLHLVDMARSVIDHSLARLETRGSCANQSV
ncbi:DUF6124 family protein [Pseudomonas maioricensis]|uniref:DUF6124 family protein n=1 Tax=Pseudomonas maioricensis TaxID=1766623 RepID=UPI0030ED2EEC